MFNEIMDLMNELLTDLRTQPGRKPELLSRFVMDVEDMTGDEWLLERDLYERGIFPTITYTISIVLTPLKLTGKDSRMVHMLSVESRYK